MPNGDSLKLDFLEVPAVHGIHKVDFSFEKIPAELIVQFEDISFFEIVSSEQEKHLTELDNEFIPAQYSSQ